MKKRVIIAITAMIILSAFNSPILAAKKTKDDSSNHQSQVPKLSFIYAPYSFSSAFAEEDKFLNGASEPDGNNFYPEYIAQRINNAITQFHLASKDGQTFSFRKYRSPIFMRENRKYYAKAVLEILELNLCVWAFDRFIMNETWSKVTPGTILNNFTRGFGWDNDTFITNMLGHPYHGAMFHTIARTNGFGFFESTFYTFLGSYMWKIAMETDRPSINDMIMTTYGGIILGEALYRMAGLIADESSIGLGRVLRESLTFLVDPVYGLKLFTGGAYKMRNTQEKHNYRLDFPLGAYISSSKETSFAVATDMEYSDYLKRSISGIGPYDWFSLNGRFGFQDYGLHDKELYTTGVLAGKKLKNNLAGLFGVFDYVNTRLADRMSALGLGPGLVTSFSSNSGLFFKSSGVLSFIFGGSSPSIDLEEYHLGGKKEQPYFFGTGMLGRLNLELGKEGLGSIQTGLSKYWVHSISTPANEYLLISSFNINYDLSNASQIRLEYDYYLRNGTLQKQSASKNRSALRALYVFKF
jgi:hypothetical protein